METSKHNDSEEKVFNDPIHGHIELHPLLVKIIDTRQFQRLRYIKQLGGGYFVFPGAAHNRFEHSLGVSHLAGLLAETLQRRQPDLNISEKDVLCVKIAGLCHDLGHGPFSHVFDGLFIPKVTPGGKWKHEKASVDMFDHMLEANKLMADFQDFELDDNDVIFIKEQIAGPLGSDKQVKGRSKEKQFLYEIVANKRNGIDVDKWDYFARDCHHLGIKNTFDCHRFMKFARVIKVDGDNLQICSRDKEIIDLYDMYHTRLSLHRRTYQHKVKRMIEGMLVEALVAANEHYRIAGKDGTLCKMSEAIDDMVAYSKLTDKVILDIMESDDQNLQTSRQILEQIHERRLWKFVGKAQVPKEMTKEMLEAAASEIVTALGDGELMGRQLSPEDIDVQVAKFDYGMGSEDPIDYVKFYSKEKPNEVAMIRKNQESKMLPPTFMERIVRVFSKRRDEDSIKVAKLCFQKWCTTKNMAEKQKAPLVDPNLTPYPDRKRKYDEEPDREKVAKNLLHFLPKQKRQSQPGSTSKSTPDAEMEDTPGTEDGVSRLADDDKTISNH